MQRFLTVVETLFLMFVFMNADASPLKASQAPAAGLPSAKADKGASSSLSGKVVETMNAGGYTYVCLEKNGKKTWVAVPEMQITVGQNISLQPGAEMVGFRSKSLNRTFESIIFSAGPVSPPVGHDSRNLNKKSGGSKAVSVKSGKKIVIKKPAGAGVYTVAEIFAKRAKLNKKIATIKAKVVKVSAGIMGKNWIHLQDGTGNAAKGTNNLVVTSQDLPAVGDIVTMKGTIYKDKDFGAGYKYSAIMEQGSIQH
jgi:hypothetical protein